MLVAHGCLVLRDKTLQHGRRRIWSETLQTRKAPQAKVMLRRWWQQHRRLNDHVRVRPSLRRWQDHWCHQVARILLPPTSARLGAHQQLLLANGNHLLGRRRRLSHPQVPTWLPGGSRTLSWLSARRARQEARVAASRERMLHPWRIGSHISGPTPCFRFIGFTYGFISQA